MKKRALISVSDKKGIVKFAQNLVENGYEILSTGGTLNELIRGGVNATDVGTITSYGELFGGRVKTLHPAVHGGILYRRDLEEDKKAAIEKDIKPIDLVCVNLYPFKETVEKTDDFGEIIENIDIGGPAMVRSAAKNHKDVLIVTSPDDYDQVIERIANDTADQEFRVDLMIKAYEHTAWYDSMIAHYMNERFARSANFASINGNLVNTLRYGENPHQKGMLYQLDDFYTQNFKVLQGEASFNNLTDMSSAVNIARSFNTNAICIVKHGNACGFSIRADLCDAWDEALVCDRVSAFGGVVAVNGKVDESLAAKMNEMFIEVVVAPSYSDEALKLFESKKRLKVFLLGSGDKLPADQDRYDFKRVLGGFVLQECDVVKNDEIKDAKVVTKISPDQDKLDDLMVAWQIAALTKSNCVTYVKNGTLVAIGMGMTSRVDAASCALKKAKDMGVDVSGCVMASEAFFPFRDSIDAAASGGVSAIAQPGGSVRDSEVIEAADEHQIAMIFTGVRHFLH